MQSIPNTKASVSMPQHWDSRKSYTIALGLCGLISGPHACSGQLLKSDRAISLAPPPFSTANCFCSVNSFLKNCVCGWRTTLVFRTRGPTLLPYTTTGWEWDQNLILVIRFRDPEKVQRLRGSVAHIHPTQSLYTFLFLKESAFLCLKL